MMNMMKTTVSHWAMALGLALGYFMIAGRASAQICSGHGVIVGGSCVCNTGYAGANCDQCATNYYGYPNCVFCLAAVTCSAHGTCGPTGSCNCFVGFAGPSCSQCAPNYYNYPNCTFCLASTTCSGHGTC